jgi:tetratricopeptide (TPR) repeat protein
MTRRRRVVLGVLAALSLAAGLFAWRQWPARFLRRGEAALEAREYDVAREQLARYLSYRPDDARARLLAARAARRLGEYYEAYEHLRRCDGESAEVEAALIGVQRGEEPSAQLRERAREDDELALVILECLIQHDLDTYRLRQALHGLNHFLRLRPDDLQALLARGFVWERFLYFADALEDYRKAVELHPDSAQARRKLAETLLIAGTPGEALEQYEWLAERRPGQPEVQLGLARCRRRLGQTEEARRLLDSLVTGGSEDGEVLWERGQVELDDGRAAEAEGWLRKAVRARPYDRRVAYSLSRCLLALARREEADKVSARVAGLDADVRRLEQVRQAVLERPHDAALRCEGGRIFLRNGEREEGLRWLRLALRLDPACQAARHALAEAEGRSPGPR